MIIERTAIYNIKGITAKEKNILYNSLSQYKKMFGSGDETYDEILQLMKNLEPTDDAPLMSSDDAKVSVKDANSI